MFRLLHCQSLRLHYRLGREAQPTCVKMQGRRVNVNIQEKVSLEPRTASPRDQCHTSMRYVVTLEANSQWEGPPLTVVRHNMIQGDFTNLTSAFKSCSRLRSTHLATQPLPQHLAVWHPSFERIPATHFPSMSSPHAELSLPISLSQLSFHASVQQEAAGHLD